VSNNAGNLGKGLATWLRADIVKKVVCSYLGTNEDLHSRMASGVRSRSRSRRRARSPSACAPRVPASRRSTRRPASAPWSPRARRRETIDGRPYILEKALHADIALVRVRRSSDHFGNLRFWRTARNFNPIMASAAKHHAVVECRQARGDNGAIDPDDVHLSGHLRPQDRPRARPTRTRSSTRPRRKRGSRTMTWSTEEMARRAAQEIPEGSIVNLGIGLPTQVADYLPEGHAWLHSENGLLGMGPFPYEGDEDPNLINAGKQTVTVLPGGSTFDSAFSFGMIRGGHVDLAIMGAMQVSADGDLANWAVPGGKVMGIGGAMDLASGARRIITMMQHVTKKGEHKLVPACDYPLTAARVVSRVITELGVFDPTPDGCFKVIELAPGVDRDTVAKLTGAPLV
jgi:3-oxoacid CoA-transferase B subunit